MTTTKSVMKMPELLVFVNSFAVGFIGAEVWRVTFYLGANFAQMLADEDFWVRVVGVLVVVV